MVYTLSNIFGISKSITIGNQYYGCAKQVFRGCSFLSGGNALYVEELYNAWKKDSLSVHKSWDVYFKLVDSGVNPGFTLPPSLSSTVPEKSILSSSSNNSLGQSLDDLRDYLNVYSLIRAHQVSGHYHANLDPLGLSKKPNRPELDYTTYGFCENDLFRNFTIGSKGSWRVGLLGSGETLNLKTLLERLSTVYCGSIGYEYMHIHSREKCEWLRDRIERPELVGKWFNKEEKMEIAKSYFQSEEFENFIQNKWSAEKRFGLEGLESMIVGMRSLVNFGSALGIDNIVIGMPHRGRLNVLANIVKKPLRNIFAEFTANLDPDEIHSGDVKYHLGFSYNHTTSANKTVHISLTANPSHLEAVDPVVVGKVRAMQQYTGDKNRKQVLGVLFHGDAAFAGQGVVSETLNMCCLEYYTVGGTIHIVCNNQIGFTTIPNHSRSSNYCTDIAKSIDAPIFHVNAENPEAVARCAQLAIEWRQKWGSDVVIDIIGYRRHGHNEIDQPMFTQPLMYKVISAKKPFYDIYRKELVNEGILTDVELSDMEKKFRDLCVDEYEHSKNLVCTNKDWLTTRWKGFKAPTEFSEPYNTGIKQDLFVEISNALTTIPSDFKAHPGIIRFIKDRAESLKLTNMDKKVIDWATAESLAFGSLLKENYEVRLSGQDVQRGTFSQRHLVLHDQQDGKCFTFLTQLANEKDATFTAANSSLSEFSVLGFEVGYSLTNPNALVIWEAQFGDFSNGAQVIFDQFISSGEQKWSRQCGITILLPHGYEGQGPEHSSSRMERYLQMCDDDDQVFVPNSNVSYQIQESNMQVINCSTPANYFHALRRQMHRDFRKPLILITPKVLLRHKDCVSSVSEFLGSVKFSRVYLENQIKDLSKVERVIFCSGKVKYELLTERSKRGLESRVAISSIEQISPFPYDLVLKQLEQCPNASVYWVQEEPRNMGAWTFVSFRIQRSLCTADENLKPTTTTSTLKRTLNYAGRPVAGPTATGNKKQHYNEISKFMNDAFSGL